jgi:hypothetical protein
MVVPRVTNPPIMASEKMTLAAVEPLEESWVSPVEMSLILFRFAINPEIN